MYSSMTPRRSFSRRGVWVMTFIPASTGVVHEAGVPAPALDLDEAEAARAEGGQGVGGTQLGHVDARDGRGPHDRGACGHLTLRPSISSSTVAGPCPAGVPRSCSLSNVMTGLLGSSTSLFDPAAARLGAILAPSRRIDAACSWRDRLGGAKSSGKCSSALRTGDGVRPPMAQSEASTIVSQRSSSSSKIGLSVGPGDDAVDHLDAAHGARVGTACICRRTPRRRTPSRNGPGGSCRRCRRTPRHRRGRALPQRPRRPRSPWGGRTARGQVGAERTADLDGPHRSSASGAAADLFDELAEADAEGNLVDAAVLDVAGELEDLCAPRAPDPEGAEAPRHPWR